MNTVEILELISTIPAWGTGEAIAQTEEEHDKAVCRGRFLEQDTFCGCCHEKMLRGEGFRWYDKGPIQGTRYIKGRNNRWVRAHASGICVSIKAEYRRLQDRERGLLGVIEMFERLVAQHPLAQGQLDKEKAELAVVQAKMKVIQSQFSTPL